ncbi:MAG: hypothetical protein QW434_03470 [Pyrobaculum sp.]
MCLTSDSVLKFYEELDAPLKLLIHYRLKAKFGKTFQEIVSEDPHNVYKALSKALGVHNAELFLHMLYNWLLKKNCATELKYVEMFLGKISAVGTS